MDKGFPIPEMVIPVEFTIIGTVLLVVVLICVMIEDANDSDD